MSDYKDRKTAIEEEQKKMDYEEIKQAMSSHNEHFVELNHLPKQNHIWTDRGLKHTCENAGHPYHEAWKIRKPMV